MIAPLMWIWVFWAMLLSLGTDFLQHAVTLIADGNCLGFQAK
jgi:hypothetical protein